MTSSASSTGSPSRRSIVDGLIVACRAAGSTHVFGVPGGGSNLDVVGSAVDHGLEFVLVHSETAAAIMAGVMGELTAAPGVCVATRGPGAASLVNGVAQALLDRQPVVVFTDSVSASDRERISHQRLDQQALMAPVAKASVVLDGRDATAAVDVVRLCLTGRPGPVHVDVDISEPSAMPVPQTARAVGSDGGVETVLALVRNAARPAIIVGVGAIAQQAADRRATVSAVEAIGRSRHVPVLCTYKGRGVVDDTCSWYAGVASGATIESSLLDDADLIIGIGLDPIELIPGAWKYRAPIVLLGSWRIDDSSFFGAHLAAEVVGDLAELTHRVGAAIDSAWPVGAGTTYRRRADDEIRAAVPNRPRALTPQQVVELAGAAAPPATIATVDAGAHMLVAMPLWPASQPGDLLISSGLATMGFALPAAIAAALARPDRRIVCFTGDGGLGMVLAELETVARLALPITIIVFNDSALSLIAAKQQPEGHGRARAVTYRLTDFAMIAAGCGLRAERVSDVPSYERALRAALVSDGPTLLDVDVDPSAYGAVLDAIRGPRKSGSTP